MQTSDSQKFKTRDATSYDAVTEQFDFFTERLTSPLAARIISLADIKPSNLVLDVGTGTGVLALQAAKKMDQGIVHGIDLSEKMLETAAAKAEKLGLDKRIQFTQMDAENLLFESETFDTVVSLYALLHFPNPLTALKEIYRVMRPGGKFIVAVGSRPSLFTASGLYHLFKIFPDLVRRKLGRQLIAPVFLDSLVEQYLPKADEKEESDLASHSHDRTSSVSALVRSAGFKVIQTDWQSHQAQIDTAEEFWEIQRTFSSISRKRLSKAKPEEIEHLYSIFLKHCEKVQASGGLLVYPFGAFFIVAVVPV